MKFYNLNKWKLRIFVRYSSPPSAPEEWIMFCVRHIGKAEDPDPVGSVDFWLPDPVLFSLDSDPLSNNGFISLF